MKNTSLRIEYLKAVSETAVRIKQPQKSCFSSFDTPSY